MAITMLEIFIGMCLSVLVHEMGHAITQKLMGLPVQIIEWGKGPVLFRINVFEMRLIPLSGGVYPNGAEIAKSKSIKILIALSGIIAQWIGVYLIAISHIFQISIFENISICFAVCAFLSFLNLIPYRGTDGYYALKALLLKGDRHGK